MSKKVITKLFIIALFLTIASLLIITNNVKATNIENEIAEEASESLEVEGKISNTHARYFDCSAVVNNGMSGGPIIRESDNYAVGIVKGEYTFDASKTYGVRITQDLINLIRDLRSV